MARTRPLRAGASKLVTEYGGFRGGYVTQKPHYELADDEFGYGQNVDLDQAGRISKRGGWTRVSAISMGGALAADGFKGMYEFADNQGTVTLFVAPYMTGVGMALYRENDAANGFKPVRVALRGPVGVTAALAGGAGGAQFTASNYYLYAIAAESANTNYANSEPAEVAVIQQANPAEQITVTFRPLRYAESYRVYRYHSVRGWEKFTALVTGTSSTITFTDTGALAVAAATPAALPTDRFTQLPGAATFAAAADVRFATAFNRCLFADGRALYVYGEYGTDLLPTQWQDFESTIPANYLFAALAGGTVAYSTSWAYTGTKSVQIACAAAGDGAEALWPLQGALQSGEVVRVTGRYLASDGTLDGTATVSLEVLDAGAAVLETATLDITPALVVSQFTLKYTLNTALGVSLRVRIKQKAAAAVTLYLDDLHVYADAAEVIRPYVPTAAEVTSPGQNLLLTVSDPLWQCRLLAEFGNRLWLAQQPQDATYAYYTDLLKHNYVPAPYIAKAETKGDDRITSLVNHRDRLIIQTRDTTQRIDGTTPSTFTALMLHDQIGCLATLSPVSVDNSLIFVARDGIYAASTTAAIKDSLDFVRISDLIQPDFDGVTNWANAVGVYHAGQYKVHFPMDGKTLRWYKPGVIRQTGTWTAPDSHTLRFGAMVARRNRQLWAASNAAGTVFSLAANNPKKNTSSYRDDASAIDFRFGKLFDLGDPGRVKDVFEIGLLSDYVYYFTSGPVVTVKAVDPADSARIYTKTVGTYVWAAVDVSNVNMPPVWVFKTVDLRSYNFWVEVTNAVIDQCVVLYAIGFIDRLLRPSSGRYTGAL